MTNADITITGAREHNLRDVSLRIPKDRITVFTGVSGSGKSSIVFDTVAVEAQRQLGDTFSAYVRSHLPRYQRPDVDAVQNLTAPVVVDQKPVGGNARSTVGTMTDIYSLVRVLYSRLAVPHRPASAYSFNDPDGMCPGCDGLGQARRVDVEAMLDTSRSLDDGAIRLPTHKVGGIDWQLYAQSGYFDTGKRLADYTAAEWNMLLHGSGDKVTVTAKNSSSTLRYEGVVARFARTNLKRDLSTLGERARSNIERFITVGECTDCGGARLCAEALVPTVGGLHIGAFSRTEVSELSATLEVLPVNDPAAAAIVASVREALRRIDDIGLGYLTLDRATASLSGGEAQRLKLVRHLGSGLVGMTYVFDEPSTGLHPRDVGRLTDLLRALRDRGNTVIVVEHDPDVIAVADHVVDVGRPDRVHRHVRRADRCRHPHR
jgi:excinuclease UvrABC ATPase subunit